MPSYKVYRVITQVNSENTANLATVVNLKKMNNNNHNHQPCDSGETLVAYLYGEASAAESEKFKAHLVECGQCAAEVAGLGMVRSAVAEWRQEEFAPMSAPAIEMPVRSDAVILTREAVILTDESPTWLEGLRAFFTPRMTLAAAGFAALIICAALTLAVLNSQTGEENLTAKNASPENDKPQAVKPAANDPAPGGEEVAKKGSDTVKGTGEKIVTTESAHKPEREYVTPVVKLSNNAPGPKPKNLPKVKQQKTESLPGVYEDAQDDSLRLADLFTETDTDEDMN